MKIKLISNTIFRITSSLDKAQIEFEPVIQAGRIVLIEGSRVGRQFRLIKKAFAKLKRLWWHLPKGGAKTAFGNPAVMACWL
jgi:hypothetical protein